MEITYWSASLATNGLRWPLTLCLSRDAIASRRVGVDMFSPERRSSYDFLLKIVVAAAGLRPMYN